MAPKLTVPTSPEGMQEWLLDKSKMKDVFGSGPETVKEFMDSYSKLFAKNNPDTNDDLRTQVQSVFADMVRDSGGGQKPKVELVNGKPEVQVDGHSIKSAIGNGKGAVYNKAADGAALERHWKEHPDDEIKDISEYFRAIAVSNLGSAAARRNSADLLRKLDVVRDVTNSFSSEEPGAGGFLIPEIMRSDLLMLALENAIVRPRATVIPMSTLRVPIPAVDETSHVTSLFGGVIFYWTEEAASLTESQATFDKIVLDAKKLTGFFKVPQELLDDGPAFAGWFSSRVPAGLAWFEDVAFLNESGAGTPLGAVNVGNNALVTVAKETGQVTNTVVWENIVKMYSRMLPQSLPNAVWICAIDTFPQLATMALTVGTGGGPVWIGGLTQPGANTPPVTILGRPVIFTEKVSALSTAGDINFVDLSYYLIGDRMQVRVDSSAHFLFQNNQVAYRIIERVDGRPWIQSALTPHNNSANTLSPFVQLASR